MTKKSSKIFTFKKLQPANGWQFFFKNDLNYQSVIKIIAISLANGLINLLWTRSDWKRGSPFFFTATLTSIRVERVQKTTE